MDPVNTEKQQESAVNSSEKTDSRPKILRFMMIGLFLYGGISYSLSMIEYTLFQTTGTAIFGTSQTYTQISENQLSQAVSDCGSQLMGAGGITVANTGDPVNLRCGRFWPFYRYTVEAPAHGSMHGVNVIDQGVSASDARQVKVVRSGSYVAMVLAVLSLGLSACALVQIVVRKDDQHAYRWSFRGFVASVAVVGLYVGFMFWADPNFGLGW
ncbi:MAG: hypothetical protein CL581_08825 [Alteromonadaceae bacterium]|nr:hypothetical protein [Alteromonadaceae bacterium]MBH86935.1 hypothetical protein [Alteromonadaceae bacterium]|tara:strand:- start:20915 stop:21550 length:636 start_codon:yes stop_codon:yes gene_type:complete